MPRSLHADQGLAAVSIRAVAQRVGFKPGADTGRVKLSAHIRVAMMPGHLHGTLVSNRHPWSERATLRTAYVTQIEQAVERCLLGR